MTVNTNTVKRFPVLARMLYKLGLIDRRQNVPNLHRDHEINLIVGFLAVLLTVGALTGWVMNDNYKSRVLALASFANPGCDSIAVVDKVDNGDTLSYSIMACGEVSTYLVRK